MTDNRNDDLDFREVTDDEAVNIENRDSDGGNKDNSQGGDADRKNTSGGEMAGVTSHSLRMYVLCAEGLRARPGRCFTCQITSASVMTACTGLWMR